MRSRVLQHLQIEQVSLDAYALVEAFSDIGKVALDAGPPPDHKAHAPQWVPLSGRDLRQHAHAIEKADARGHHALAAGLVTRKLCPVQDNDLVAGFCQQTRRRCAGHASSNNQDIGVNGRAHDAPGGSAVRCAAPAP
jgi:hypothetical protein